MTEDIAAPKTGMPLDVRIRLSLMMFLQFMMFPVWFVPLATYLGNELGLTGTQRALIMSVQAFGCLMSPIVGMIADRHFASQKVLAVLNLLGGVMLIVAANVTDPTMIFIVLVVQQLFYMPTWGLTSAIAMSHSPAEKFPQVRVFGSIGWVAAAVFAVGGKWLFNVSIDGTAITFYCGAGVSIVAAATALLLPNTPPPAKGQKASIADVLGLKATVLLKDFGFAVFMIASTLVMIPFSIYWSYCSVFLADQGFEFITATMNWGQFVEMFIMLLVPIALARLGVKWAMTVGLVALVIRYLLFLGGGMYDQSWMYFGAILIHGVIFGMFFVGGQVYVDKRAPSNIRAQAQGFLFLMLFGVGLLVGNFFNEELIGANSRTTTPVVKAAPAGAVIVTPALKTDANAVAAVTMTDVRLHDRALSGTEVELLTASEKLRENLLAEAKKKGESPDEKKGQVYSGKPMGVMGKPLGKAFSFSAKLTLPADDPNTKDDDVLSGTLFATGTGDDAIRLALEKNVLVLSAGETKIEAKTVGLTRKPGEDGNVPAMDVTATYDDKGLTLYTGSTPYRTYDWDPIWTVTVGISAVLLVLFVVAFHYKEEKPAEAPAVTEDAEVTEVSDTPDAGAAPAEPKTE